MDILSLCHRGFVRVVFENLRFGGGEGLKKGGGVNFKNKLPINNSIKIIPYYNKVLERIA